MPTTCARGGEPASIQYTGEPLEPASSCTSYWKFSSEMVRTKPRCTCCLSGFSTALTMVPGRSVRRERAE